MGEKKQAQRAFLESNSFTCHSLKVYEYQPVPARPIQKNIFEKVNLAYTMSGNSAIEYCFYLRTSYWNTNWKKSHLNPCAADVHLSPCHSKKKIYQSSYISQLLFLSNWGKMVCQGPGQQHHKATLVISEFSWWAGRVTNGQQIENITLMGKNEGNNRLVSLTLAYRKLIEKSFWETTFRIKWLGAITMDLQWENHAWQTW